MFFFGDGASEEGSVYESICFAKLKNLPVIYVCENNRYAINTPLEVREPLKNISDKFSNILPVYICDGNNIEEVVNSSKEAVDKVRNGSGPVFLEYKTYRIRDHHNIGYGINENIRTQKEWDCWVQKNPIEMAKKKILSKNEEYKSLISEYEEFVRCEIEEAFSFAEESKFPRNEALWGNLWGKGDSE